jgi:hypothetical protein
LVKWLTMNSGSLLLGEAQFTFWACTLRLLHHREHHFETKSNYASKLLPHAMHTYGFWSGLISMLSTGMIHPLICADWQSLSCCHTSLCYICLCLVECLCHICPFPPKCSLDLPELLEYLFHKTL